jgi:hypothetical protein
MPGTHFQGPLLGNNRCASGLFEDMPISALSRRAYVEYFEDFHRNTEAEWTLTTLTSGSQDILNATNIGVLRLTATTANQGIGCFQPGASDAAHAGAIATAGVDTAFEVGLTCNDWADCDWAVGLGAVGTTFLSSAGVPVTTVADNAVFFHHLEAGSGVPLLKAAGAGVANIQTIPSTYTAALTNGTFFSFGIRISGRSLVRFYINQRPVSAWTSMNTAMADGEFIVPSFAMIANGNAINFDIDYVLTVTPRNY